MPYPSEHHGFDSRAMTGSPHRRRLVLGSIGAALAAAGFSAYALQPVSRQRIAWLDVQVPTAEQLFVGMQSPLQREAAALGVEVEVSAFYFSYEGAGDSLKACVDRAIAYEPDLFVCLSHHSALLIRQVVPEAEVMLVTVLDAGEVGLATRRLAGISFDKPASTRALSMLSRFDGVSGGVVGIAAASEWLTPGRLAFISEATKKLDLNLEFVKAENQEELLESTLWRNPKRAAAWWVPESIVLFRNRDYMVSHVVASGRPHVFGRRTSVEKGAMLGLQPIALDWRRWLFECLADYVRGTDIENIAYVEVDAWHCFANQNAFSRSGVVLPESVLGDVDAFV